MKKYTALVKLEYSAVVVIQVESEDMDSAAICAREQAQWDWSNAEKFNVSVQDIKELIE